MKNIKINLIIPHKDNPRKDIGDLTELSDSIKENGIFQNLTVHNNEDGTYTAIIGHRRLEAAKLAGLTEVPCAVVSMSEQVQVSTMLLENMQRTDLTPYEQAQGFQMCLELGLTKSDLSKKTGLSRKTVKHRLEMLKLDREKLAEVKGGTIEDYIKLEQVKLPEKRNELLEHIGTSNFNLKVNQAIAEEKAISDKAKQIEVLESFAEKIEEVNSDMKLFRTLYDNTGKIDIPDDAGDKKYYYIKQYYYTSIYTDRTEADKVEMDERIEKEDSRLKRFKELQNVFRNARVTRFEFIRYYAGDITNAMSGITGLIELMSSKVDISVVRKLTYGVGFTKWEDSIDLNEYLKKIKTIEQKKVMGFALYSMFEVSHDETPTAMHNCKFLKNEKFEILYKFLIDNLGYEISDEEQGLIDGTHELFEKSADELKEK